MALRSGSHPGYPDGNRHLNLVRGSGALPPPVHLTQAEIDKRAREILKGSSVDKDQVTLAADKASSDQMCSITVILARSRFTSILAKLDGFHAELERAI